MKFYITYVLSVFSNVVSLVVSSGQNWFG